MGLKPPPAPTGQWEHSTRAEHQAKARLFIAAARAYGDVVCLPAGPKRVYLVNHPDHIKRVLQDNHRNYRLTPFYGKLRPIFGEGLLTSEGDLWRRQRHLIQPAFHRQRLERLGTLMTAAAATMLGRWEVLAENELDLAWSAASEDWPEELTPGMACKQVARDSRTKTKLSSYHGVEMSTVY